MSEVRRSGILLVTRNLPPLVGGMELLNWHMADELAKTMAVRVIAPFGSDVPERVTMEGVEPRPAWKFLLSALTQALRIARSWKPAVVLAGSGLTAPVVWLAAHACGAKSAVYLHGLDIAYRHPAYAALWLPFIRRIDVVIANSSATKASAVARGVPARRIAIVHPGAELPPPATHSADDAKAFRSRHGLGDGPILLSVGRLTERKGIREFVDAIFPLVVAACPDAQLVVVGDEANDALAAKSQSKASIIARAMEHGLADHVHFLGTITDRRILSSTYQAARLHVFPVRELAGDPEGFGMVAIEAAAHGLPTVAFATGGIVDSVSEGENGRLVANGDCAAFARAVIEVISSDPSAQSASAIAFAQGFSWERLGREVLGALESGA